MFVCRDSYLDRDVAIKFLRPGGDKEALAGGKQIIPTRDVKKADVAEFQANLKKILGK